MRTLYLASAAALVIATPAMAQDAHGYVGIDAGALFPKSQSVFGNVDFTNSANTDIARTQVANVKYKTGYDIDLIGGYDFGMFRLEGELGYKRATAKSLSIDTTFLNTVNTNSGTVYTANTDFGLNNRTSVYSAMLNGLVDFGGNGGVGAYVGGGAGYASVHQFGNSKGKFAWQLLAGVYAPVSSNIDVGLKYRYFRAGANDSTSDYAFSSAATTCGALPCSGGVAYFDNNSRFTSHSLMLSLAYNFGGAVAAPLPPPPPPPPPVEVAPATQTCPDGSVILATSMCPMAPPPPPPPPAPVERGERGR